MASSLSVYACVLLVVSQGGQQPEILHVGTVAPDVIGLTIQVGRVEYGRQIAYERQDGDRLKEEGKERLVFRGDECLGWLVGREGKLLYTPDQLIGKPLDTALVDATDRYRITSSDDAAFSSGVAPTAVFRKSKPSDFGRDVAWIHLAPVRHVIYLKLPRPLTSGGNYQISFPENVLPVQLLHCDPLSQQSEAVHVSHIGFRPDDPAKRAFLSCWLGSGGPLKYSEHLKFFLVEHDTGRAVLEGTLQLAKAGSDTSEDAYRKNYAGVDVYEADFSAWRQPGTYRVSVEGVGCSYPFEIVLTCGGKPFRSRLAGFIISAAAWNWGHPTPTFSGPAVSTPMTA